MDHASSPLPFLLEALLLFYHVLQLATTTVEVIGPLNLVVVAHKPKTVVIIMLLPVSHNRACLGLHNRSLGTHLCGPTPHGGSPIDHQALFHIINNIGLNRESSILLLLTPRVLRFHNIS